jgi:hypothetical protein
MADTVQSDSNVLYIRFFATHESVAKSKFSILYTGYRERNAKGERRVWSGKTFMLNLFVVHR